MKKSWAFFPWVVGQFEIEIRILCLFFFYENNPVLGTQQIICILLCTFNYNNSGYSMIWLSSKFHPVLCVEHNIFKMSFASREVLKSTFL